MRKLLLSIALVGISVSLLAQNEATPKNEEIRRPTLGINFILNDFSTAMRIKSSSLASVVNKRQWSRIGDLNPGFSIQYMQGIHSYFDFSARLDASFARYTYRDVGTTLNQEKMMLETDISLMGKLFDDNHVIIPYATAGVGAVMLGNRFGAFMPLGGGFQFNLGGGDYFITTGLQYRLPVSNWVNYHLNYSLGFAAAITERKAVATIPPPPAPVVEKDTDGDGIVDSRDKCVTEKGTAKYHGCPVPDTDADGINDEADKCPTEKGTAKYEGCPIPDTDGDAINDEEDKCPKVAGLAKYQGCPIPDSDEDGLNDEEDKCPNEPGQASNQGCPTKAEIHQEKVAEVARNVFFATGSATLLKKSHPALDEVVKLLKENADLSLDVEGHTDNTGTDKVNQRLSQSRADAVAKYLKSKGVKATQIRARGYGSAQPIADNGTEEGRQQNRRVELKLK